MFTIDENRVSDVPNDPRPQAVYYGARTPILDDFGDPVLDANRVSDASHSSTVCWLL